MVNSDEQLILLPVFHITLSLPQIISRAEKLQVREEGLSSCKGSLFALADNHTDLLLPSPRYHSVKDSAAVFDPHS